MPRRKISQEDKQRLIQARFLEGQDDVQVATTFGIKRGMTWSLLLSAGTKMLHNKENWCSQREVEPEE